jgi:hypothetical protein
MVPDVERLNHNPKRNNSSAFTVLRGRTECNEGNPKPYSIIDDSLDGD